MINFDVTKAENTVIRAIAKRAHRRAAVLGIEYPVLEAMMDVTACHANGCPLRLNDLANADDANFGHDVFGIRRHLNRETGRLEGFFMPRFARPVPQEAA